MSASKSNSFAAIRSTKFCSKQSNIFNFALSSSFVPQGSLGKPFTVYVSCDRTNSLDQARRIVGALFFSVLNDGMDIASLIP